MLRFRPFCLAAALTLGIGTAQAAENDAIVDTAPSAGAMAADLLVVRPVSLVAAVLGTGLFIVQLPLSAIQGEIRDPARKLVADPWRYTFTRPLGEID